MADKPESLRHTRVSRRTQVIRKAASEDARRHGVSSERLPAVSAPASSASRRSVDKPSRVTTISTRNASVISGRFVAKGEDGTPRASVRLRRGDTLVHYKGGETLIRRRVVHKTNVKRNVLIAYGVGYAVLFALYAAFLMTGSYEITSEEYLRRAFAKRHGETVRALQRAAVEATRGNRTPAEVRFAKEVSFYDAEKELVVINAGDRVTLLTAAKLGEAVIEDLAKPEQSRSLPASFSLYKESWLTSFDWTYWLMAYNLLGFYILVILYLWKPIAEFFATQGKKTSIAIENARRAQDEAENLRDGYRQLAADIEARRDKMQDDLEESVQAEHEAAIEAAQVQAMDIAGAVETAMDAETHKVLARIKTTIVNDACQRARDLLSRRVEPADHDRAVDDLIADIGKMKLD